MSVDCRVPRCKTIDDVLAALTEGLGKVASGDWLIGFGNLFFDQKLAERRLPSREELDRVSRSVPIVLRAGGHVSVLNSPGIERAGLERFMGGGEGAWGHPVVELDAAGNPTGVVGEVDRFLPIPDPEAGALKAGLESTFRDYFTRFGVTTIGEMVENMESVRLLDELVHEGRLHGRVVLYTMVPGALPLQEAIAWSRTFRPRSGSEALCVRGIKLFMDGGYSARNAATRTEYVAEHAIRPGSRGKLNLERGQLVRALSAAREEGLQIAVHANGERAQDEVIDAVESANLFGEGPRIRVEHAGNLVTDLTALTRWKRANITAVAQPGFLYSFIGDFFPLILGDGGRKGRLPMRTLLDERVSLAISSDVALGAEEGQTNPLFSVWCCARRSSFFGRIIEPEEAIGVREALALHTIEAARALELEDSVGSIEAGKLADIVVLDRDPFKVGTDDLPHVQVDAVMVGGRIVYERPGSAPPRSVTDGA
jgi:predicted amidohydrolase YtcJ